MSPRARLTALSHQVSTAAKSGTPSAGCCNTPAVIGKGYKEKGTWTTIDGLKTYATGPSSAKKGILVVYDIFGFFPQTLQGADILATSDKDRQYKIFMPDFFEGKPADISWYPPDTDEKGKKLGQFFQTSAAPPKTISKLNTVMQQLKSNNPDISDWGIIVNLVSQAGTPFKAAATCHPAMVDPKDAPEVTIPILTIASQDESKDDVGKYEAALKVPKQVEWYDDQIHGFMAARGDLEDDKVKAAYEKAYQTVLGFFHQHL
ncbi:hypothetical protein B0A52_04781 [Exophiala mesophila]|uniref:Dienelactone hydrolase domain-containing protein n=1 Tax=Exophiala mesophila TaxID=212818 RepID=A0A438N635_EXOME|nr:hypothetical protein B0A52_04781 [Exophiala mesophila]